MCISTAWLLYRWTLIRAGQVYRCIVSHQPLTQFVCQWAIIICYLLRANAIHAQQICGAIAIKAMVWKVIMTGEAAGLKWSRHWCKTIARICFMNIWINNDSLGPRPKTKAFQSRMHWMRSGDETIAIIDFYMGQLYILFWGLEAKHGLSFGWVEGTVHIPNLISLSSAGTDHDWTSASLNQRIEAIYIIK